MSATSSQRPTVKLAWEPHEGQEELQASDARFRAVACGRRFGKTEWAAHEAFEALGVPDNLVWWVAPTYDIADIGFNLVEGIIPDRLIEGEPKRTKPKAIDIVNGATVSFRSADREDSLRGEGIDLLIMDEAAMIPKRAWTEELRPALSDTLGDMIAISTPKGRDWFFEWFERGQSEDRSDIQSWNKTSYENPHVPDSEIDDARQELPERVFQQEYLAEFLDDSGGVFPPVREYVVEAYDYEHTNGVGPYVTAVDFARHQDWTVIIALDATGKLVAWDRMQKISWPRIQSAVEDIAGAYPGVVAVDASRDNKIVSDLEASGLPVDPISFSPKKKRELIENLITRIENAEITIPEIPQLVHELNIFEYDTTPAGNVRYNAPSGMHDDAVDALALAASKIDRLALAKAKGDRRAESAEEDSGRSRSGVSLI